MKTFITLALTGLISFANNLWASQDFLQYQLYGQGDQNCEQAFSSPAEVLASQSWTQGYLSGHAFIKGLAYNVDEARHTALLLELQSQCQPNKWLVDAMHGLLEWQSSHTSESNMSTLLGAGTYGCMEFMQHIANPDTRTKAVVLYQTWMEGYISAAALDLPNWSLSEMVQRGNLLDYLGRYCSSRPQSQVVQAGIELIRYLEIRKEQALQAAERPLNVPAVNE